MLNVRDVVELLRDFLRAKALTESEISREVCGCAGRPSIRAVYVLYALGAVARTRRVGRRGERRGEFGPPLPTYMLVCILNHTLHEHPFVLTVRLR